MQIRFIPLVKFIYYKSSKFGGWMGKVGGGGHILKSLNFRICPPFITLHNGMNLIKLFPLN